MSENSDLSDHEAIGLLRFYAEAGVIDLLDDAPLDRFAQTIELSKVAKQTRSQPNLPSNSQARAQPASRVNFGTDTGKASQAPVAMTAMAVPDQASIEEAKALAKSAKSIDELRTIVGKYSGCSLKQSAKNTVFSDGNPDAPIMIIGEAPARDEDQQGTPFVGPVGQLMDKMLAAIRLDRQSCYLTNVIPWRPPGNRTPTPHEIELCRPFVERHIELAQPKLLVFMGNVSNRTLLKTDKNILSMRGTWSEYQLADNRVPAMSTFHPNYLLKTPIAKRNSWSDLLAIRAKLDELT